MKYFRVTPLALATALISTPLIAAPAEEIIVTGSYNPVASEKVSSLVSIINSNELLQLSNNNLLDALRHVPSLWVEEQGGPGGVTSISLRGAEANHTLVLIDGVQMNDPTNTRGGAFDLTSINIESVDRVEIIRGAQSAIYGSDALAGVIHIITKAPGEQRTTLNLSLGTYDYAVGGITTSGRVGDVGYAIGAQVRDSGDQLEGSSHKNSEFTSRLQWANDKHGVQFGYRYFDGSRTSFPEQSGGPEFALLDILDNSDYTDNSASLSWRFTPVSFWSSSVSANWYDRDESTTSPGILPFDAVPPTGADIDFTRTEFNWVNTLGNTSTYWANVGVETRNEKGTSVGYMYDPSVFPINFGLERDIDSAFLNLNGYVLKSLLLQASVRSDDADGVDTNTSGQFGAKYSFNNDWTLFANWGEAFKLPSFFALGHSLVGNPDLLPETVETWDAGIEFARAHYSARMSYFDHRYSNLIDFDSETFKNVNRSRVDTSGVELEVSWQAQDNLHLRAHATYIDIDVVDSESVLLGRPQNKMGISAHYAFNDAWQFNANYMHVDQRFAASRYSGEELKLALDSYDRLDVNIAWQLDQFVQLSLALDNLTDEDYYTDIGFPATGTTAKFNVKVSF